MLRPRIIPCLLVHDGGLVKSRRFGSYQYVGDPLNAVKIFNEMEADELVIYDIDASRRGGSIDYSLIERVAKECRMPLCYGGGVGDIYTAQRLVGLGVEKVSVSSAALRSPSLVSEISGVLGSQSVAVTIDVKASGILKNHYHVVSLNGSVFHKLDLLDLVEKLQDYGAGEIIFNSVDFDGEMAGYDFKLIQYVKGCRRVPFTFLGGCGSFIDMQRLVKEIPFAGCGAGSFFVFRGKFRSVLISYPDPSTKSIIFS